MAIDRRKRPLVREPGDWRDASLFIIATEGEKTEPRYFDLFRSPRVKVQTLGCIDGRSSPDAVLNRISEFKEKFNFDTDDTFWLVVDRDRWTIRTLSAVFSDCKRKNVGMIISNPQFEIWLAYHFDVALPSPLTKTTLRKHLIAELGSYNKSTYPTELLVGRAPAACAKARAEDTGTNAIWPDAPGSRVYLLMEELLKKMGAPSDL